MTIFAKDVPPDIQGSMGLAWVMDVDALARKGGNAVHGTVKCWSVRAPWAHPLWHSYHVVCLHLRPIPGEPPAKIMLAGATHEVMVIALHPDDQPALDDFTRYLTPINFSGQFIAESDVAAALKVEQAVRDICDGKLSPDTDYMRSWMHRFSDSNIKGDKSRAGEPRITVSDDAGVGVGLVIPPRPGPQDLH